MGSAPKEARRRAGLSSPRQRSESVDGISAPLDPLVRGFDPEQALRTSEERYQLLFKKNLAGVFLTKLDGEILDCNQSFARMLGYRSSEEVTPLRAQDLYFHDNDRSEFIQRLIEIRSLTNLEVRLKRRDGSELWTLENVALIGEGENALIQGTTVDITARKQAERALTESESKFRAVADMASSAIYIHDYQHFIYVNRASQEITGYSEEELLRMDPFALVHPDFCDLVRQRAVERLSGAQSIDRYEFQIVTKRGERRWVDFSAGTISFGGQQAILCTAFDVTEHKRAELLQSALYRISDCSHAASDLQQLYRSIHKIIGELIYAENFYIALLDQGREWLHFVYSADEKERHAPRRLRNGLTEYVLRTGKPLLVDKHTIENLKRSGQLEQDLGAACVDWMGVPLNSGSIVFGVVALQSYDQDVRYAEKDKEILTFVSQHIASAIDRKRKEEALRESEACYRSLVQSAVYGIYRSSVDDRFLEVNPALVSMLGYDSAEELLQVSLTRDLYVDPEQRMRLIAEHNRSQCVQNIEVRWRRKDGRPITVRLSGRSITNSQGQATEFEMIAEDVTERRALEDQLRQSQKMEAIGCLAGGIAHDFNNLLTVIKGYSELMLEELELADPLYCEVDEIKKAADRAASLTRQLLAFSRQQVLAPRVLDLNSVIHNMDRLLHRLLGEGIELTTSLQSDLCHTKADPGQIEQVVMNLAVNARDAMPNGGQLTIETRNVELDENYVREHMAVKPGSYVMIAVSDTGIGMTEEIRGRIFEPFFTTKEPGKGTGLGLSTVYGIVKQSEGCVWVYSEAGIGTTFKVYLPRVDAPADVTPYRSNGFPACGGAETILLVEDEDGVRALVRQILIKQGYTVLESRHAGEALLLCERHRGKIDLLLTDVVLQQMSGRELAERLIKLRPEMRVLYVSGYTDDAIVQHGVLNAGTAFLQKPFTTDALTRKVRQVLNANLSSSLDENVPAAPFASS